MTEPRRLPTAAPATDTGRLSPLPVDLFSYDVVVVSTSGGKDSQTQLAEVVALAKRVGYPLSKIVAVHADLGRVEWDGTHELARAQAEALGVRFEIVRKAGADLLDRVRERAVDFPGVPAWPGSGRRFCTSDFKRGPIWSSFTQLVRELRPLKAAGNLSVPCTDCEAEAGSACVGARGPMKSFHKARKAASKARPKVRILNAIGLRAAESTGRSKLSPFTHDKGASNSYRHVDVWLPIHAWSSEDVWASIKASGLPHHRAYDLGMPRLSCVFCIYSPTPALLLAGEHNPEKLQAYVDVERETGYSFKGNQSLADIQARLARGERQVGRITTWEDCG